MNLRFILIQFSLFGTLLSYGQTLNGKWFGRAEAKASGTFNTYLCEISLQKNSKGFYGNLNYFFGSDEYNVPITAKYWPATKTIELNPFPLITYFAKDSNAPDCLMDGSLSLYVYEKDSSLFGQLNPVGKYRNSCPVMTMYLVRERETPGMFEAEEDTVDNVLPEPEIKKEKIALPKETNKVSLVALPPAKSDSGFQQVINEFEKRNAIAGPLLEVDNDSITLHLYDNGKVDGDSVSVFFNRNPVVLNQQLGTKPVVVHLQLLPGVNEIAMFAINLGEVPPNTALCIIYAGNKRYDLNVSSTLGANGTIRIQRKQSE